MNPLFGPFSKVFLTVMETNDALSENGAKYLEGLQRSCFLGVSWLFHGSASAVGHHSPLHTGPPREVSDEKTSTHNVHRLTI